MLVPEGRGWCVDNAGGANIFNADEHIIESGRGAGPAIALCIAALKARATERKE
jgi:hypothetical protein